LDEDLAKRQQRLLASVAVAVSLFEALRDSKMPEDLTFEIVREWWAHHMWDEYKVPDEDPPDNYDFV
jgi:hypothetical protein